MTKDASTQFGEPLSVESAKLVNEVRLKLKEPIHPNVSFFDGYWLIRGRIRQFQAIFYIKPIAIKLLAINPLW